MAEDLCRVARVEDFIGIEICDFLDKLFSLQIEQINLGLDLIFKFLVICRYLVSHIFSDDLRIDLRALAIAFRYEVMHYLEPLSYFFRECAEIANKNGVIFRLSDNQTRLGDPQSS